MFLQPQLLLLQKTMITVEGVARKLDPEINFWEVSKPEIETWLKDELGIKNRLKQTQETLQSIARKMPDIPDFISRADQAFNIITEGNSDNTPQKTNRKYFIIGGTVLISSLALIISLI